MNTSIEFYPGFKDARGVITIRAAFYVAFPGYDNWTFTFTSGAKSSYQAACRFVRLVEKGYAPVTAHYLAKHEGICPTKKRFELKFDVDTHTLSDERVSLYPEDDCEGDGIINDWLSDAYSAEYGLDCGDEVETDELYHFFMLNYGDDMPVPEYLREFALSIDLAAGYPVCSEDWNKPHHSLFVSY